MFGDSLDEVLILGAGTGTDVAAALRHGAKHVTAVDIDPVILRLGAERHPDKPYSDPRVTVVCDDARHFLRTTTKKYDLVVFALIDSLTVQSSFSGVRLESYMFTKESFEAVRDHLSPRGVMVLYNYFREKWLVDRLANTAAEVFGRDPLGHVHQDRAYLAVMLAGPRVAELAAPPPLPADVNAYGQAARAEPRASAGSRCGRRAGDRRLAVPVHAGARAAAALPRRARRRARAVGARRLARDTGSDSRCPDLPRPARPPAGRGTSSCSAPASCCSRRSRSCSSRCCGARRGRRRRWRSRRCSSWRSRARWWRAASRSGGAASIAAALLALIALNYFVPVGRVPFDSRAAESLFYGVLVFSPVFCAGLLFSSSFKESSSTATDFGANLLGAIVGGVGEYLSLLAGYQFLLDAGRRVLPGGDRDRAACGSRIADCGSCGVRGLRIDCRIADCGLRIARTGKARVG